MQNENTYTIENRFLRDSTDYVKNLYLKMLAAVIQSEENIKDVQVLFFDCIVAGAKGVYSTRDYLRQSLEIKVSDLESFCDEYKNKEIKHRFILDAILIAGLGEGCGKVLKLVSDLTDCLEIKRNEIEYLSALAKSILRQNNKDYIEAKEKNTDNHFKVINFADYLFSFAEGIISNQPNRELIVSGKNNPDIRDKAYKDFLDSNSVYGMLYTTQNKYKNIEIRGFENFKGFCLKDANYIKVSECKNVKEIRVYNANYAKISNCEFKGGFHYSQLNNIKKVIFDNCTFYEPKSYCILGYCNIEKAEFNNCRFINCQYTADSTYRTSSKVNVGGVIHLSSTVTIKNCRFENCGVINDYYAEKNRAVICNGKTKVENSHFINSGLSDYSNWWRPSYYDIEHTLFPSGTENINNTIENSAKFC